MRAMRSRGVFAVVLLAVSLIACTASHGALDFSPDRLPNASVGQPFQAIIQVTNNDTPVGDMYVSSGTLPPGMTLNFERNSASAGSLAGTPTTAGTYVLTVSAWCLGTNVSGQSGQQSYSLVVS
jgi:hypothetical protein